jgi:hypothetical protein
MIGDSPKGIPTITVPASPAPVVVGCQRFWKRPFIYQIREVITTNSSEKPCVVEWPDGMSHLPLFNAEGPIASTKARIAVRMESGRSGQAVATAPVSPRAPPGVSLAYQPPDSPRDWRVPTPKSPRNMGGVPAPFSPRLKTGGGGTKPPRLYRGGNPASNAYMY